MNEWNDKKIEDLKQDESGMAVWGQDDDDLYIGHEFPRWPFLLATLLCHQQ